MGHFAAAELQLHPHLISPIQEFFAGRPHNNPDFSGADPTVYTNLWLQIRTSSWPTERECAAPPYFHLSQFLASHSATPGHSNLAAAAIHRDERSLIIASRREVVGNNFALAR